MDSIRKRGPILARAVMTLGLLVACSSVPARREFPRRPEQPKETIYLLEGRQVRVHYVWETCETCAGARVTSTPCIRCDGKSQVSYDCERCNGYGGWIQPTYYGTFRIQCGECDGEGDFSDPCVDCYATGRSACSRCSAVGGYWSAKRDVL
jgi:DnaJ-class molecular chaperone